MAEGHLGEHGEVELLDARGRDAHLGGKVV
jgi:hypothetical protein